MYENLSIEQLKNLLRDMEDSANAFENDEDEETAEYYHGKAHRVRQELEGRNVQN